MLSARNLTVTFRRGLGRGRLKALDDVTFDVGQGEFFALLGQNGAGKSTAMSCFLGLLRPTSGSVTVFGREPRPGSGAFREIGYLPEEPTYHGYLTVLEAVTYYGRLGGSSYALARRDELLERFGLAPFRDMRVDRCSKGMKQKVGIVQCLLNEPRLLFLDEPMRGLDPVAVKDFRDVLVGLHHEGATIVMNSHILAEVQQVATRAAILDRGRLLRVDSVANLRSLAVDEYEFEIVARAPLPGYVSGLQGTDGHIRGTVPAERLWEFLTFCREGGGELASCARRQASLEESYFAIVGREHPDA